MTTKQKTTFDVGYMLAKFTSRKWLLVIGGVITVVMTTQGYTDSAISMVTALVVSGLLILAFVVTEGWKDIVSAKTSAKAMPTAAELATLFKSILDAVSDTESDTQKQAQTVLNAIQKATES